MGFLIGASTAAHQVEGNNCNSDFWVMEHLKHSSYAEPSGNAVDHYHRYEEDIKLLADAGLNAYRFSIEWARIEPEKGSFDRSAVDHYRRVLEYCHSLNITPVVTLHHFSSPAWLIREGGWGREAVISYFSRYCGLVARELGGLMPYICTINEANMGGQLRAVATDMMKTSSRKGSIQVGVDMSMRSLLRGMLEQGRAFHCNPFGVNTFLTPRSKKQEENVMRAHQMAYKSIKNHSPQSRVGLTVSLFDYQSINGGEAAAAKLWNDDFGFYLPFIQNDDFLGVQNYTRKIVDAGGARVPAADAPLTQMGYEDYPSSIGHVLHKVAEDFKGELIVTENGIATENDSRRCAFITEALNSVEAAKRKGVQVSGYFHWSLLDNFEWQAGFSKTFGLVAVNRNTQTRYPKPSLTTLGRWAKE